MFILITTALALDCTGLDEATCNAANDIAALSDTVFSTPVLFDTAAASRHQTQTVYDNLLALRTSIEPTCTISGILVGRYSRGAVDGVWEDDTGSGTITGSHDRRSFLTDYAGSSVGTLGDPWGRHTPTNFAGARDGTGFVAGHYARISGRTGAWYGFSGTCTDEAARVLDPWYPGNLRPYYTRRVFASTTWQNPMIGIGPMDDHCQADWDALGSGPGSYLAAVTDHGAGIDSPADRFAGDRELVLAGSGDYVADDVTTFFDYRFDVATEVDIEADGTVFPWIEGDPDAILWWGDFGPGAFLPGSGRGDCDGWTSTSDATEIIGGQPSLSPVRFYSWAATCAEYESVESRMFCIER